MKSVISIRIFIKNIFLLIVFLTSSIPAAEATITISDGPFSQEIIFNPTSVTTFDFPISAGANRMLIATITHRVGGISSLTYDGMPMTEAASHNTSGPSAYIFYLALPGNAAYNGAFTITTPSGALTYTVISAIVAQGVDIVAPIGSIGTNTTTSSPSTINLSTSCEHLVIDVVASSATTNSYTPGGGQSVMHIATNNDQAHGSSYKIGSAASTSTDWSWSGGGTINTHLAVEFLGNAAPCATAIQQAEYFFDTDPGIGNGTALTLSPADPIMHLDSADVTALSDGFHTLSIRFRDDNGNWSFAKARHFYKSAAPTGPGPLKDIVAAEYFIDTDPGVGNGTPIAVSSPSTNISLLDSININGLTTGFHQVSFRVRYADGLWSQGKTRFFYISPTPSSSPPKDIVAAEYFFDTDPGVGNGTSISVSTGISVSVLDSMDVSGLLPGFHQASVRFQYDDGQWGHAKSRTFYINDQPGHPAQQITHAEYFFNDDDPGWGKAFALNISNPNESISWSDSILTNSLSMCGTNTVHLRVKSSNGFWSAEWVDSFQLYSYAECACALDSLFLSQSSIPSDTFQVVQKLESDGMVQLDSVVVFYAEEEITLYGGFEVVLGGVLSAGIESCGGMREEEAMGVKEEEEGEKK